MKQASTGTVTKHRDGTGRIKTPEGGVETFLAVRWQLLAMAGGPGRLEETAIDALTRVHLTRLDKVLYPAARVTKGDVLTYYIRVAPLLLPFLQDRPLTMHRFPDGFGGEGFFEKDAPAAHRSTWTSSLTFRRQQGGTCILLSATISIHSSGSRTLPPLKSISPSRLQVHLSLLISSSSISIPSPRSGSMT